MLTLVLTTPQCSKPRRVRPVNPCTSKRFDIDAILRMVAAQEGGDVTDTDGTANLIRAGILREDHLLRLPTVYDGVDPLHLVDLALTAREA